ncbi:MAG: DUF4330 family protein [Oscillospiraceae bacterium]
MKPKFNIVDLIIILVCVAIVAVCVFVLPSRGSNAEKTGTRDIKAEYVVEVNNKEEAYTKLGKVGDVVSVGDKEKLPAVIKKIEVKPYRRVGYDTIKGEAMWNEVPEKFTVLYTLESDAVDSEKSIAVNDTAIRVGEATTVKGKGYAGYGYILSVKESK